ncbi:ABC transporter substrate-binding protein [Streptomyces sp. GQFP]|uniref:ABC transporter substrate-binding protein n=1 Tax=Streptomyces sp. GQFP TaxID=2907545 RepID=UPI001F305757|nr:ABC transporter substrate-binding protein [Streptomyces sp. GQFP]UIX32175.1 ABC transporter substrate-binding protein [Streptomyces sp. GQFP]
MPSSDSGHGRPGGFPGDGAIDFIRALAPTVVPKYSRRKSLDSSPPLFVLRVPATMYETGVRRVVNPLIDAMLTDNSRQLPYARLIPEDDHQLLVEEAGTELTKGGTNHTTPDRHPYFHTVRDLVAYIRDNPANWATQGSWEKKLRTHACEQRAQRGGLLGFAQMEPSSPEGAIGGAASTAVSTAASTAAGAAAGNAIGGVAGLLTKVAWLSFVQRGPRRLWSWWTSRKVMGGWIGNEQPATAGQNLFKVMNDVGAQRGPHLRDSNHLSHEDALRELDWFVLRALLEDLRRPPVGRFRPARRRRICRPVVIVQVPPPGAPGARAAERFLRALHRCQHGPRSTAQPPGPLVLAVGAPSDDLLKELGARTTPASPEAPARLVESSFTAAAGHLADNGGPPVLVRLDETELRSEGTPVGSFVPDKKFAFHRYVPTTAMTGATVLAMTAAAVLIPCWIGTPTDCLGGTDSVADSDPGGKIPVQVVAWYDAAKAAIDAENLRAEDYAETGREVRSVVVFVSQRPRTEDQTRFDGTIPELRGIAMWQRTLNEAAASNSTLVPLKVLVRETGEGFRNAEAMAEDLVREVRAERSRSERDRIVGVLGYAQSREETQAALQILGRARIPTIGTTATADEMSEGDASFSYWPFTPANSREARIEADFAGRKNIVALPGSEDECAPAEHAIVVESSADLYSRSLATRFMADFPGDETVFNFNQEGDFDPPAPDADDNLRSADILARRICDTLAKQPESVVYWSARAKDFTAFVNSMDLEGTCLGQDITVLGGNELTNVAQTGVFRNKTWLRLYYSAHRMPYDADGTSTKTKQFVREYESFVDDTTDGTDPWKQDGHSAVSYDAFHVLSQAVSEAYQSDPAITRNSVVIELRNGVHFDGATGSVSYAEGSNAPPVDKTLVLLRQLADGPRAVVACGAYGEDETSEKQGPPCAS